MKNLYKPFYCFLLLVIAISLNGCVDLTFTQTDLNKTVSSPNSKKGRVYAMRGVYGVFSTGVNTIAEAAEKKYNIPAATLTMNESTKLANFLIKEYKAGVRSPIILIGHSAGTAGQIMVAKDLRDAGVPVKLLILLDTNLTKNIPSNVETVVNFHTKKSLIPLPGFHGGPVYALNYNKTKVININLDKKNNAAKAKGANHFNVDKHPSIQAYMLKIIGEAISNQAIKNPLTSVS